MLPTTKAHLISESKEQERLRNKYAAVLSGLGVDPNLAEVPLEFLESQEFTGWTEEMRSKLSKVRG